MQTAMFFLYILNRKKRKIELYSNKILEGISMSFGKKLCNLSIEAAKNGALLRDGEEVWKPLKETLEEFAKKTGERGCNIFFENIPNSVIAQLKGLGVKDDIELMNWNSPSDAGHPGPPFEQIGVITWDSSWYFSKYPFKVSRYSIVVEKNDDGIKIETLDAGPEVLMF